MELLLYAVVKFIVYSCWGYVGLRLHQAPPPLIAKSFRFGTARWLLGLFLGILVFVFSGSINREQVLFHYIAIYVPVRVFEWAVMAAVFFPMSPGKWRSHRLYFWIIGGIVLSFLTDFVSPEMIEEGRFCVGRCLC